MTEMLFVEARRILMPSQFGGSKLPYPTQGEMSLSKLQEKHKDKPIFFTVGRERIEFENVRFSKWLPEFKDESSYRITVRKNPALTLSDDDIFIDFDSSSLASIQASLREELLRNKEPNQSLESEGWGLIAMRLHCSHLSSSADCLSIFKIQGEFSPVNFNQNESALACAMDALWPVHSAILAEVIHSKSEWIFEQPITLAKKRDRGFDPSLAANYNACLIITGSRRHAVDDGIIPPPSPRCEIKYNETSTVLADTYGTMIWYREDQNLSGEKYSKLMDDLLGTVITGHKALIEWHAEKTYSNLLKQLTSVRTKLSAEELRKLVFHYEFLRSEVTESQGLLSNANFRLLQHRLSAVESDQGRVDRLGDLILKGAEGIEWKLERAFERSMQIISVSFFFLTLITFGFDCWLFTHHGEISAIDFEAPNRVFMAYRFAQISLALFALGAVAMVLVRRRAKISIYQDKIY